MKLATEQFLSKFASLARPLLSDGDELQGARALARRLGAQATIALAQQAALALVDRQAEQAEARLHDDFLQGQPAGEQVLAPWNQLQELAGSDLPAPKVTNSPMIDLGAQAGDQVFVEESALQAELSDPAQLGFLLAHEMGHVVNRDSVRRAGVKLAVQLFSPEVENIHEADRASRRQMELEADEFAAGLMRQMKVDSGAILAKLLSTSAGNDHPDGLLRAQVVRGYLPVSDETWAGLLQQTSRSRAKSEAFERDQVQMRKLMASMV